MRTPWRPCSRKTVPGAGPASEPPRAGKRFGSSLPDSRNAIAGAQHIVANPLIEVDGDRARGVWYLIAAVTQNDGTTASNWPGAAARYHEEYVKQNGEWKFRSVRAE